jgi:hypothetical protein
MEMLAIICIPVNCAIVIFTGDGTFTNPGESSLQKYLENEDFEYWTPKNIIYLAVFFEHAFLFIKIIMSSFISDVPHSVRKSIKKRP